MKFGHKLEDDAIPEWAPKYINYKQLKKLIHNIPKLEAENLHPFQHPSAEVKIEKEITEVDKADDKPGTTPLLPEEKEFLSFLTLEVHKVENFYFEQLKVARNKKDLIMQQIEKLLEIERLQSSRKGSLQDSYDNLRFSNDSLASLEAQQKAKESDSSVENSRLDLSADGSSDNLIYQIIESRDDLALLENEKTSIEKTLNESTAHPSPPKARANSWSEGLQTRNITKSSEDFFIGTPATAIARSREASLAIPMLSSPKGMETVDDWNEFTELAPSLRTHPSIGQHHSFLLQDTYPKHYELPQERRLNKVKSIKKQPPLHHHRHHKHKDPRSNVKNLFNIKTAIFQHTSRNNNAFAKKNIRKALIELYRSLELLKEFRDLNILAYNKIVKKFEKNTKHGLKETLLHEFMITPFYTSTEQASMFQQVEDLYEKHYANGDHHLAMKALRTLGFESIQAKENAYDNLFVGLFTGINIMLTFMILKFMFKHSSHDYEISNEVNGLLLMYFGFGFPLLISNLIIINMYVWDRYKINYRLVCGVSPRTSTSQYAVFVSFLFLVYLSYVYISVTGQLDGVLLPISQVWVLLILMLTIVANSFKYYQSSRIWLGVLIWRIVSAPLYPCIFKDFFVADQLVSMSPFYQSVGLLLYATFTRSSSATYAVLKSGSLPFTWYIAFFPMIPFFWRAMQCLRRFSDGLKSNAGYTQLINCSRYSLGIMVLILNTVQTAYKEEKAWVYLAIIFRVVYSMFSYYWDINMDWGLGNGRMMTDSNVTESNSDAKEKMIVYPAWVYYFVIATDGLTRFIWLPFSILSLYAIKVPTAGYYLAVIELLRRFQWNFVRVEIEHVHNCEKLQVTEDVDLPFRTQDLFVTSTIDPSSSEVTGSNRSDNLVDRYQAFWQPFVQIFTTSAPSISQKIRSFFKHGRAKSRMHRVESIPHELEAAASMIEMENKPFAHTRVPSWIVDEIQLIFKTKKRNTTIEREIYAGVIQFLESFYVLAVIPFQLNGAGYDSRVAVIGTCTACCVGCIVSGLFTDLPFMLAPSVAVSIFFAVSMERANLTPDNGSASLIISGFMLCLLGVLPPVDRFLTGIIPDAIQAAVSIGLGLITSLAGLTNIDLIVRGKNTLSDMGEISVEVVVTFSILVIIAVLFTFKQKGGFSLCLVGGSVVWWIITSTWPRAVVLAPTAASDSGNVHDENVILLIFNLFFLYILILNSLARPLGALSQLLKKSGELPRGNILFIICGLSTMLSGYLGGPPILLSAESVVGIQAGGRTGLSTCICGVCFGIAIFFFPLFASVPACAVSAILIMVGVIMFGNSTRIRWNDYHAAVPAFCVTCLICFTYSILRGVAFGYGLYIMINLYTGRLTQHIVKLFQIYRIIKRRSTSRHSLIEESTVIAKTSSQGSLSLAQSQQDLTAFGKTIHRFHKVLDNKFALKESNMKEFVQL